MHSLTRCALMKTALLFLHKLLTQKNVKIRHRIFTFFPIPYSITDRCGLCQLANLSGQHLGGMGHDMLVQMELSRIIISEINSQQIIYLREVEGTREFYIVIGIFEATSIDRRVKGLPVTRPLTHDLIRQTCDALGGKMQDIVISRLEEQTYFAQIRIQKGNKLIEIDARPSDAIAIAMIPSPPLPIFVAEEVLDKVLGQE